MKRSSIKKIKVCFGNKDMFYKEKLRDCIHFQFKRRCLLQVNGKPFQ